MATNAPLQVVLTDRTVVLGAQKKFLQLIFVGDSVPVRTVYDLVLDGTTNINLPVNETATVRLITQPFDAPGAQQTEQSATTFDSFAGIELEPDAFYDILFEDSVLAVRKTDDLAQNRARTRGAGARPNVVFVNETGEEWFEFVVSQIDTVPLVSGLREFGIFNMIPAVDLQGGESVRDWNTAKMATVNLLPGKIIRLLGILSSDHARFPSRTLINLAPAVVPEDAAEEIIYRVRVDEGLTELVVCGPEKYSPIKF